MATGYSISELENKIEYHFKDKSLVKQSLTHSSYTNEQKIRKNGDYERLEFLGDAVLELISSEFLFKQHPDMTEGKLTKLRSSLVCEPALAQCAKELDLGSYMLLGKGEEATGGRYRESITSDVMEALIGALYLDGGYDAAHNFIMKYILSDIENRMLFYDSKTVLQEIIQTKSNQKLVYVLVDEIGPDHNKEFVVEALLNDKKIGFGQGKTKKAAEQKAAYEAILYLRKNQD